MFESFKETWRKIEQDPPGRRFRRQYRRRQAARQGIFKRALFIGVGSVILVVGIILLFTPGPGLFFVFVGWGLIAQESLLLAIILDKLELYLRGWSDWAREFWGQRSVWAKALMGVAVLVASGMALYLAYTTLMA